MKPSPDQMRRQRQLRLQLQRPAVFSRQTFVVSQSNALALAALDAWPNWHGGRLALVGPQSCGKTHLAMAWAAQSGAIVVGDQTPELDALRGHAMLFEDADRRPVDERLFHLINMADAGASLLITARTTPVSWPTALPDLRSRLNALAVAQIEAPDDGVLDGVLRKLFRERNIRPAADVYPYLVQRMERSVPAALDVVSRLDELADAEHREITRALARQILEHEDRTLGLFD
ncbi:MAG TPA: chromosomal replication initiator DnaA [Caulobacteraceae bacterium]